jgi:thermolysin
VQFLVFTSSELHAIKAPDNEQPPLKSVVDKKSLSYQTPHLKSIHLRNIDKAFFGDVASEAERLAQNIFNYGEKNALSGKVPPHAVTNFYASLKKDMKDNLGMRHIRIRQTYKNIPVVGSELVIHLDKKNRVYMINGKYEPQLTVDITPSVDANTALSSAMRLLEKNSLKEIVQTPSLVIYNRKLAWHFIIKEKKEVPSVLHFYIDAKNGTLLNVIDTVTHGAPDESKGESATVTGNRLEGEDGSEVSIEGFKEDENDSERYFLYSFTHKWGIYDTDADDWEQNASSSWGDVDPAAISCAKNVEITQEYVQNILGKNSFDDDGAFLRSNIHVGENYVNAYWDGSTLNFGDGDNAISGPLTVLDVTAHEYGHAITQHTSNLTYAYESGALNEAYSDIFGTVVEFYGQPDGTSSYPDASAGKSDWLIGEDCWLSRTALRDMKDPRRYGQPSLYLGDKWYIKTNDHGGVHTNSGVANFAFYLLSEGGNGTNEFYDYNITGMGIEKAAAVALRANYFYHTSDTTYLDARHDWIQAAKDLGYDDETVAAVWDACGVTEPHICDVNYTIIDKIPYVFEDISSSGTEVKLDDDDAEHIKLPFFFKFGCETYAYVNIGSNGIITFTKANAHMYENKAIPSSAFKDLIAPFWDDLNPSAGGSVYFDVRGDAPRRRFIIQWNNVPHFDGDRSNGLTFQAILFESTDEIVFYYKDTEVGDTDIDHGASATVGIQINNEISYPYLFNEAKIENGTAILFTPAKFNLEPVYYLLF